MVGLKPEMGDADRESTTASRSFGTPGGRKRRRMMRQFQIHVGFSALTEKDALDLSKALETVVSVFCARDPWCLHAEEEGHVYTAPRSSYASLSLA
jgi:hypothetical protein